MLILWKRMEKYTHADAYCLAALCYHQQPAALVSRWSLVSLEQRGQAVRPSRQNKKNIRFQGFSKTFFKGHHSMATWKTDPLAYFDRQVQKQQHLGFGSSDQSCLQKYQTVPGNWEVHIFLLFVEIVCFLEISNTGKALLNFLATWLIAGTMEGLEI